MSVLSLDLIQAKNIIIILKTHFHTLCGVCITEIDKNRNSYDKIAVITISMMRSETKKYQYSVSSIDISKKL